MSKFHHFPADGCPLAIPDTPAVGPPFGRKATQALEGSLDQVGRGFWAPGGVSAWPLRLRALLGGEGVVGGGLEWGPCKLGLFGVSLRGIDPLLSKPDCKPPLLEVVWFNWKMEGVG